MQLRKSTKIWLAVLGVGVVGAIVLSHTDSSEGCVRMLFVGIAWMAALVLLFRGTILAFRGIVRRLTLRLAFSYFLIGIVPIPLLACLLFVGAYLVAHQMIATRVHAASQDLARQEAAVDRAAPGFQIDASGKVIASDVPWIAIDSDASWAKSLSEPRPVVEGDRGWLASPAAGRITLLLLSDPENAWAKRLSDVTGYAVLLRVGSSQRESDGITIDVDQKPKPKISVRRKDPLVPPAEKTAKSPDTSLLDRKWIAGVYVDPAVATFGTAPKKGRNVVVFVGRTTPRTLYGQLFAQGLPDVGRIFWTIFAVIAGALLVVYLVALILVWLVSFYAGTLNPKRSQSPAPPVSAPRN